MSPIDISFQPDRKEFFCCMPHGWAEDKLESAELVYESSR